MTERDAHAPDDEGVGEEEDYDEMERLEPSTAGEPASRFEASKRRVRTLLEALSGDGRIGARDNEPNRSGWNRDASVHECPECGYEYEVTILHPVLSAVRYCPHCGTRQ